MKYIFAKLFEIEGNQVLVTKEEKDELDGDVNGPVINVRFSLTHVGEANQIFSYDDEESRDKGFALFDESLAKAVRNDVMKMFKDFIPTEGDNNAN
jgi:hypothetical protein